MQQGSNEWNSYILLLQGQKPIKIEENDFLSIKFKPYINFKCLQHSTERFILITWHLEMTYDFVHFFKQLTAGGQKILWTENQLREAFIHHSIH